MPRPHRSCHGFVTSNVVTIVTPSLVEVGEVKRRNVVVAVLSVTLAVMGSGAGVGAESGTSRAAGSANAFAQSFRINPKAGSLSVGIGFGLSLAAYQNAVGIAESRSVDLGIVGSLLAARNCMDQVTLSQDQQPHILHVEARGAQSSVSQDGTDAGGAITKHVEATTQPTSRSVTTNAPLSIPGLVEVQGSRSESRTRFLPSGVREAIATSDIAALDLAGGMVRLKGLHWEATFLSGAENVRTGKFSVGSLIIGGAPVPVSDPAAAIDAVNQALAPLGLALVRPAAHEAAGFLVVDPLQLSVVPNTLRDTTLGTVFNGLQPLREQLVAALFSADCRLEDVVTVVDILIGSISGAGTFNLELGGVSATSREINATGFLQRLTPLPPAISPVVEPVATPAAIAPAVTPAPALISPVPATRVRSALAAPRLAESRSRNEKGGTLLRVAMLGVALLLLAALGDVYKMRRAQRARAREA